MDAYYVVPATTKAQTITTAETARANALGCTLCVGDPSGKAVAYPSAVVISSILTPVVFADTAGQATVSQVAAAKTAATAAEAAAVTNTATLQARAKSALATNGAWLTAAASASYPLTRTEQMSVVNHLMALTRQMDAVIKLILELVTTTTGT